MPVQFALELHTSNHETVLSAVKEIGRLLKYAAEACRGDREVALSAASLQYATEACRGDCEIVLSAVKRSRHVHVRSSGTITQDDNSSCPHGLGEIGLQTSVRNWTSLRLPGLVSEYPLLNAVARPVPTAAQGVIPRLTFDDASARE
eukprot:2762817-Amphidinium_carterae.2